MSQQLPEATSDGWEPNNSTTNQQAKLLSGDELLGRVVSSYRLDERLGGGAMASVYRATNLRNGQSSALKMLLPGADSAMRERFRREVETVRQLNHPNIVRTLEVSSLESGNLSFIAMELVEGESLAHLLERNGQLSMVDSCALLTPIARALAYAHERGVVHRDVKPSNILLRRSTWSDPNAVRIAAIDTPVVPLLSDFGIALVLDAPELTNAGRTIGTPAYMAPEQCADSREIDGRADIYALGAVLFRCLIGRPLFLGSTTQILHAHVYEPVAIPEENMRLLPPLVVEILQLALAKNPEERYDDAAALAEDLAVAAGQRARSATRKSVSSDATATMTSLPAASAASKTTTHILIPAPSPKVERTSTSRLALTSASIEELPEEDPVIPLIPPRQLRAQLKRDTIQSSAKVWQLSGRWAALLFTSVVVVVAFVTAFIMWPQQNLPHGPVALNATTVATPTNALSVALASPTATVTASATDTAVPSPTATQTETPLNIVTDTPASVPADEAADGTPTPNPLTTRQSITPSVDLDADSALSAAQEAIDQRQWSTVIEYLAYIRLRSPNYSPDSMAELLGESYLTMAALNNQNGIYTATIDLLKNGEKELTGYPVVDKLTLLSSTTESIMRTESPTARIRALSNLRNVHLLFAAQFVDSGRPCQAMEHVAAAKFAAVDDDVLAIESDYEERCKTYKKEHEQKEFLASLRGELLYSAQVGGALEKSNVYRMPIQSATTSTLLIANARYPVRQRAGSLISFYSTSPGANGIYGFDLNKNFDPAERGRAIAQQFAEDGSDSPGSWSFEGDRLVFASTRESDRRPRLFIGYSASAPTTSFLSSSATWPAWRPLSAISNDNWVVYNGKNLEANEPGLWLADNAGVRFARLTDNGDDIAPTWSPNGDMLFFMNGSRDSNWDIYYVTVSNPPQFVQPIRFTDSAASDVMPAVSPDGNAVAFLSDRGGRWQVWIAPIEGGEPILVRDIEGTIPDPTKQSMQWTR